MDESGRAQTCFDGLGTPRSEPTTRSLLHALIVRDDSEQARALRPQCEAHVIEAHADADIVAALVEW